MKKLLSLAIVTVIGFGLSGCGTKNFSYIHDNTIKTGSNIFSYPKLNKLHTEDVGSNMYEKTNRIVHDTKDVEILESINIHTQASGQFIKSKGYVGILLKDNTKKWKSSCTMPENKNNHYSVCLFDSKDNSTFDKVGSPINTLYADLKKPIPYIITNSKPTYNKDSFKYIALYQGKKGSSIKISFREFKDNMARPAFTQDIDYELSEKGSTTIGFKGLRIEVLKATNLDITYKVIRDYK